MFIPFMDCTLADRYIHEMIYYTSRDQPYVEWIEVFSVVKRKAEEEVCHYVIADVELPPAILPLTRAFDIDLLSVIADDIVAGIVHGHSLHVLEYFT
jgi:hypothetical protein